MRHDAADAADGTQPSEPSWSFADPLAGTSGDERNGSGSNGMSNGRSSGSRNGGVVPTSPNPETVRALLNDVFVPASEHAAPDEDGGPAADGDGEPVRSVERSSEETRPGMLPTQRRTWPTRRRLTRQAWRPRRRPRLYKQAAAQRPPSLKPTRGFAGVLVAILLAVLFCLVAVAFVVNFIGMFTGAGG